MTSPLRFRNVSVSPTDPVQSWPMEAVRTALERGSLTDWRRIVAVVQDPWSETAARLDEVLRHDPPYGVVRTLATILARARAASRGPDQSDEDYPDAAILA